MTKREALTFDVEAYVARGRARGARTMSRYVITLVVELERDEPFDVADDLAEHAQAMPGVSFAEVLVVDDAEEEDS